MVRRRLISGVCAFAVFAIAILAAVAAVPYVIGLFLGCFPPTGSCGDGVGWAMILSAPVSIPLALIVAAVLATLTYRAVMRATL